MYYICFFKSFTIGMILFNKENTQQGGKGSTAQPPPPKTTTRPSVPTEKIVIKEDKKSGK
jgi:hypothetical protein